MLVNAGPSGRCLPRPATGLPPAKAETRLGLEGKEQPASDMEEGVRVWRRVGENEAAATPDPPVGVASNSGMEKMGWATPGGGRLQGVGRVWKLQGTPR